MYITINHAVGTRDIRPVDGIDLADPAICTVLIQGVASIRTVQYMYRGQASGRAVCLCICL